MFALDLNGTRFHPKFPITQPVSSAQSLLNFLCGNALVFFGLVFWLCWFFFNLQGAFVFSLVSAFLFLVLQFSVSCAVVN